MPAKTIFVKEQNVKLYEEAEKIFGENISEILAQGLKELVEKEKLLRQRPRRVLLNTEPIPFEVSYKWDDEHGGELETWAGKVTTLYGYGTTYECHIESRSGFIMIFGEYINGWYACIPDWGAGAGCALSGSLKDVFYNTERLTAVLGNAVDGATAAKALAAIANRVLSSVNL